MAQAAVLSRSAALRTVWGKTVRDQRRSILWWALGLVLTVLMYTAFWPSIRDNAAQFNSYMDKLPEAVKNMLGGADYGTPEGYLGSELFAFLGPVLLMVYAIGAGARAIAGEEEEGTLELLLSTPVRRRRVVADKFLALFAGTALLTVLTWAAIALFGPLFGLDLSAGGLAAICLNLFLLAVAFGAVALAIGAATGTKALAIGAAGGLALITFLLKTFAASISALEPYRYLSPFHYYIDHDPLRTGFDIVDPLVLAGISVAALAIAFVTFERRDLTT